MERKAQKNGLVNLVCLALAGGAGYGVAQSGHSLAGATGVVFMGLGVLVAAISWFQMRLEEREYLEKLEFEELRKTAGSATLFNTGETEVFPAQRSREQFERFFVPIFTVVLFFLQVGAGLLIWRSLQKTIPVPLAQPAVGMALFGLFALILFMLGKYSTGIARLEKVRLLRPGASYTLFSAYVCFIITGAIAADALEFPKVDLYVARALAGLLMLTGVETLINLILEIYRPRVRGKVERPIYESRLVSLLGQPEGLITTAAQTLDYQFGFKVSDTWAYKLFEQWLPWLIIAQFAVLLVSTSFVFIDVGQQGILEHFGRPAEAVLEPGAHVKWPWPIDKVYRYATEQIQTISIGYTPDDSLQANRTVLWTVGHNKEENFLVANREVSSLDAVTNAAANRPPPVSLLTVSIPVQFQITNITAWVYNNEDPVSLIDHIATREVVRYFVSVDLQEIMSRTRADAAHVLRDRIQAEADRHLMGASIVFVGLEDIHPPSKVAPDYEKVIAATHTKESKILDAKASALLTVSAAEAQSYKVITEAESERTRRQMDWLARAASFTNQLPAFLASPSVYAQRAYLQSFARSITNARLYVNLATNTTDVIVLNLEDKIRQDILDAATLPPPKTPAK